MKRFVRAAALVCALLMAHAALTRAARAANAPSIAVLDAFESSTPWETRPADGVEMKLSSAPGRNGGALRIDFNFAKGGGYAVVHRALPITLPSHYRFHVAVRGACAPQDFEFKLIDASGDNVWWCNRRMFHFPEQWSEVITRQRQITFAWGPAGGGPPREIAAVEFAITAGSGGAGTVWLDDLTLETLPPPPAVIRAPVARASSAAPGAPASAALDTLPSAWRSASGDRAPWIALDLGMLREFGGLVLDWEPGHAPAGYRIRESDDGRTWRDARVVRATNGGRDWIDLPDHEARHLRIEATGAVPAGGVGLASVALQPLEWAASPEAFARAVAHGARRGLYPRGVIGEQNYWAVVGVDADRAEGLLDESGALETGKARWSVEPFLRVGDSLRTWNDVTASTSLHDDLPMPNVRWTAGDLTLDIETFAEGGPGHSVLRARYRLRNTGNVPRGGRLALAIRPFQVNPPQQFLNTPGGTARVTRIEREGDVIRVNGTQGLVSLTTPQAFGASDFDQGDAVADFLARGTLPSGGSAEDPTGRASAVLSYDWNLAPGMEWSVDILVPLHAAPLPAMRASAAPFDAARDAMAAAWRARYDRVRIDLPPAAGDVARALKAQIGWILVNRDSAGIQPGSRSYERSWIRDGALTSTALLRLGQADVVKEFIEWFAPYQYGDGKIPCCVDRRGSDPVPEHDSHGEFIYLVAEYLRITGDRALAGRMWPHVRAAAAYLDTLRAQRRTAEWRTPENAPYFGLLPPSISHEGYSAKPMHSYWDDLFGLRGYKDAVYLARTLGHDAEARAFAASRDTFAKDLHASILAAQKAHRITFMPGCADLGDEDATSTTIALDPVEEGAVIPAGAVDSSFARYWEFFRKRRDGVESWEAYTPYEMRTIGAFVRLGQRDRADAVLDWFMTQRKPAGWEQWPEVVRKNERTPAFLGDLPHTWVGSDFARSVIDMFAYERERDSSLVIGAGVPAAWLDGTGVSIGGLRTAYGPLTYRMSRDRGRVTVTIDAGIRVPPGGIVVTPPITPVEAGAPAGASVYVGDRKGKGYPESVNVTSLPATVTWLPQAPGPLKPLDE